MDHRTSSKPYYDASMIQVLELPEAVRTRPGLYIGCTGKPGPHELLRRSIEDLLKHYRSLSQAAEQIIVRIEEDESVTITSRGDSETMLFLEWSAETLEYEFQRIGRTFLAAVNALCERLSLTMHESYNQWRSLLFERGILRSSESHHVSPPDKRCDVWLRLWPDFTILEPGTFDYAQTQQLIRSSFPNESALITVIDARVPSS